MNKSSKRFISRMLAFVMVISAMFTNVFITNVAASEAVWVYGEAVSPLFGLNTNGAVTLEMGSSRTGTFSEPIFKTGAANAVATNAVAGRSAYDIGSAASKTIYITPTVSGTVALYIMRQSSDNGSTVKINNGTDITTYGRSTQDVAPVTVEVTAGTTYSIYSNNTGNGLFAMKLTYAAAEATDVTLSFADASGAEFTATDVVITDGEGSTVTGTESVYALSSGLTYTASAEGYVSEDFVAGSDATQTVTMTPIWNLNVTETNSVEFTLNDSEGAVVTPNEDGTYPLVYGATYTANADAHAKYEFTVDTNATVSFTMQGEGSVTINVTDIDGVALTGFKVIDSEGVAVVGKEGVYSLVPDYTYTVTLEGYTDYTFTAVIGDTVDAVLDELLITTTTVFNMDEISKAITAVAGTLPVGTEVKDGKLSYFVNSAATSYSGSATIGDKSFTSADSAIQKFKTNGAPTSATSGGQGLFKLTLMAGTTVKIYAYNSGSSARNFTLYDATGDSIVTTAGDECAAKVACYQEFTVANTGVYYIGATNEFRIWEVDVVPALSTSVTGTVTVGEGLSVPTQVIFTETESGGQVVADVTEGIYTATLVSGKTYNISCNDGTLMADADSSSVTVAEGTTTVDLKFVQASEETVTGTVYGLAGPSVCSIEFSQAGEMVATAAVGADGTYTIALRPGTYNVKVTESVVENGATYTPSALSTADLLVEQGGAENYKNVLYTTPVVGATSKDLYVGPDQEYTKIQDAVKAIEASSLTSSATDKFIVHIAPGTYEEQVIVNANNVTFICDTDDDLDNWEGTAKISWYYGIDYAYYSCHGGYYDEAYAVDKHAKGTPDRYGTTVRVRGSNFYAHGIDFTNTFNKSVNPLEIEDGVTALGLQGNTSADRTAEGFDPCAKTSTERAAAIALDGSNAAFYRCEFVSSQDTVYTGSSNAYFNNCSITGQTDYIFGNDGNFVAFDGCNLNWCGYSTGATAGYITAARGQYIFRDCVVTSTSTSVPGYYGRPWGASANVSFINCDTQGNILDAGWASMSGVTPDQVTFREYNNRTSNSAAFASTLGTQYTADEAALLVAEKDAQFYGAWLPASHVPYEATAETTYGWDFTGQNIGNLQGATMDLKSDDGSAVVTLDGTSGKIAYHSTGYGFVINAGSKILFTLEGEGNFPTTVKVDSSYQSNVTKVSIYNVNDMTTPLAEQTAAGIATLTFDLGSVPAGDYAIVYSDANSFYTKGITIVTEGTVKAPEVLPEKIAVSGTVTGLEADDTAAKLKYVNVADATDVAEVEVVNGAYSVELYPDAAYSVVAVGKGIYKINDNVNVSYNEATTTANLTAVRIIFALPNLAFKTADAIKFFDNATFTNGEYTDQYSGVTYYPTSTAYAASHGLKAASNKLVAFTASESGTINVDFTATTNNTGDSVQLMINGTYVGTPVEVVTNQAVTLSTAVTAGAVVTVCAPIAGNLYYSNIDVTYTSDEDYSLTWGGVQTMANAVAGNDVRLLGTLSTEDIANIEAVGFAAASSYKTAEQMRQLDVTTVFTSVLAGDTSVTPAELNADGKYIAAYAVTGMPNSNTLYVYTYYVVDGVKTYSDVCYTVTLDENGVAQVGTYNA